MDGRPGVLPSAVELARGPVEFGSRERSSWRRRRYGRRGPDRGSRSRSRPRGLPNGREWRMRTWPDGDRSARTEPSDRADRVASGDSPLYRAAVWASDAGAKRASDLDLEMLSSPGGRRQYRFRSVDAGSRGRRSCRASRGRGNPPGADSPVDGVGNHGLVSQAASQARWRRV